MRGMVGTGAFEAGGGVAVLAAEQAGVVSADVFAGHAAAGGALGGVFLVGHIQAEHFLDVCIVHTLAGADAIGSQVQVFGAAIDLQAVESGSLGQTAHEVREIGVGPAGVGDDRQVGGLQPAQAGADLLVNVHDADHRTLGGALQGGGDLLVGFDVEAYAGLGREDDWVVAPDDFGRADQPGKLFEDLQGGGQGRSAGVELAGVIEDGVLEIIAQVERIQLGQVRQQRGGVARPEDDHIDIFRLERDVADLLPVEGVGNRAVTGPDAVDEPGGIKGGDIGAAAGAEDHWWFLKMATQVVTYFCCTILSNPIW